MIFCRERWKSKEELKHLPYSSDLDRSNFHLFPKVKDFLGENRFDSVDDLKEAVNDWSNSLAVTMHACRRQRKTCKMLS